MRLRRIARRRLRRLVVVTAGIAVVLPGFALAHDPDENPDLPPVADLDLRIVGSPVVVQGGEQVTFTLTVRNAGPNHARRVRLAIALTGATGISDAEGLGWSCDVGGALASCTRAHLRRGTSSTLTVTAVARPGFQRLGAGAIVAARPRDPDPSDNTASTMVSINNPPVVTADAAATDAGVEVDIPVLDNDIDPDGDQLDFVGTTQPAHGTVTCGDFVCAYAPAPGFLGVDTFAYTVADGRGATGSASVTVTVTSPPPLPPSLPPPPPPSPPAPPVSGPGVEVSGPGIVRPGQVGGFTIVVSNGCVVTARDVVVRLTLPAGSTLVSAPARSVHRGRLVTVRLGSVRKGAPRTLGVRVRFGRAGGTLRTLVVALTSSNARLTGDGVVVTVR